MDTIQETRRSKLQGLRDAHVRQGHTSGHFALVLGMSAAQLSQMIGRHPSRPVSESTAREVEKRLRLPAGYLDRDVVDAEPVRVLRPGPDAELMLDVCRTVLECADIGGRTVSPPALVDLARLGFAYYVQAHRDPAHIAALVALIPKNKV